MVVTCEKVNNSDFCKDNAYPGWDDPILGTGYSTFSPNEKKGACVFIASISAVAWVWPQNTEPFKCRVPSATDGNGIRTYTIPFRLPNGNYSVVEKVAWENGNYCYSHSRNPLELWVALYEKAYVKRMMIEEKCVSYVGAPFPVTPIGPLGHITGCNTHYQLNSANIYATIKAKCYQNKTKYPTVVWADHAWTVLGFMAYGGTEYLILRDPTSVNAFIRNDILENVNWDIPNHFYWNPITNLQSGTRGALAIMLNNGIFGLRYDRVQNYFQGAAWAGPA